METKIVVYFYTETAVDKIFSENHKPAVLSYLVQKNKSENYNIFKQCGGLKILDYFKNDKTHVRMSFWASSDGYNKWQQHEDNQQYIKARASYQIQNRIVELLEGPFLAIQND